MNNRYFHDERNRTVYSTRAEPNVNEKKDKNGNRTGWSVDTEIRKTRADNALRPQSQQWKYPVNFFPQEHYAASDSRAKVIGFFNAIHVPNYPEIDEQTYQRLNDAYRAEAEQNTYS